MMSYKVEYTSIVDGLKAIHVNATSREQAMYLAFDEISDKGIPVEAFGDVWMLDDETQQWVKTYSHQHVSKVVR